ncbi:Gfo/Idh/MocA family oxidoreductase [Halobacteria archaeon AArc-m2/3/4]|uniref:Gfo/Idh/MocA family oxidoreductase n=1 Tax=Natronoglomus mannanivorans TaxID=2979990 RepID=A0ABT2QBY0_9EURY|nr:Gfo/Idh/MocA family oxidoreductase [Halobacteria archaeon AArc-m2/3/4]
MTIDIGIVGAGNRGQQHAGEYETVEGATVAAVADIDEEAATELAEAHGASVYGDFRDMLEDAALDAVSVCVHNNLHRPVTVAAAEAGCHVFCEKPLAATYTDAKAMADACEAAGVELGVQNVELFTPETRAARTLIDDGKLGDPYYARGVFSRRRGRPYIDGYGTPSFVSKDASGGGPVIDIGTYVLGQLLYLLGNAPVERVGGSTFEHTADAYDEELVGDREVYGERLAESGYDVEDAGVGFAHLEDGSLLSLRAAWHMFLPDEPSVVAGSQGGLQIDPFEFYTTTADYEATVSLDLDEFERRQGLLGSETGYDVEGESQFAHWIDTLEGDAEAPIPTGELALNSMLVMEGIYLAQEAGRELTAEEIADRSESSAVEL